MSLNLVTNRIPLTLLLWLLSIACIDGVNWKSFDAMKLSSQWDQSLKTHLPVIAMETEKATTNKTL